MATATKCFTVRSVGRTDVLKSPCQISSPYNPNSHVGNLPQYRHFDAVWDTGATMSSVSPEVIKQCGLIPHAMAMMHTANGTMSVPVYKINIVLRDVVEFCEINVTESKLSPPTNVLIGMDIIGQGDFAVTNREGQTYFSYRYPSVTRIDFVQEHADEEQRLAQKNMVQFQKAAGNKLCPCGSDRKFRYCHGRKAS